MKKKVKIETEKPETEKLMLMRLGLPVCNVKTWNTLTGCRVACYVKPRCRWLFFGMCYCPMPEKHGIEMAYPVHFLYRRCYGKYRDWVGGDQL